MIRVNLLPVKRRKKTAPVPAWVMVLVFLLLVTGLGLVYTSHYMNSRIKSFTAQKKQNEARLKELDKQIREVKNYEQNNREYEEKSQVIEQLGKNQNAPVRMVLELAKSLTDGVWVVSLKERGGQIDLKGKGFTNSEIVNFVDSLKTSEYFSDVVLVETKRETVGDIPVYSFSARLRLKV